MKRLFKFLIGWTLRVIARLPYGHVLYQELLAAAIDRRSLVEHHGSRMTFFVPNALCRYRADTFATKEPETLTWLESMSKGAVLWDVGANVGLYSIYGAMHTQAVVFAFEPSVFNLELLARNIYANELQERITIVPLPLSEHAGTARFKMTSMAWGGALSSFGVDFGQDGKRLHELFEYGMSGLSMDDVTRSLGIPPPDYIKMDVDGIEHLILAGGTKVLQGVKSVLVEINDDFEEQAAQAGRLLAEAGLVLLRKCDMNAGRQYNQWWARPAINP